MAEAGTSDALVRGTMVDSRENGTMAGNSELVLRVARVEEKLDALTLSVDTAFVEQRQYTEFAFDRVRAEMRAGFDRMERRFTGIDARFTSIDARFSGTDARLDRIDGRLDRIDARFTHIDARFSGIDGRFDSLERKLDQFIDTQSRANALVERHLERLESSSTPE